LLSSFDSLKKRQDLKNGFYRNKYLPIETMYPKKILLNLKDEDWKINSFDPFTREICYSIKNFHFSYTIPVSNYF
jgi:hypothetical protein